MSLRDQQASQFKKALTATPGLWRSIDVRTIAVRVEGAWHNVLTRIRVDPRDAIDVPRIHDVPDAEPIATWQELRPFSELDSTIDQVLRGQHSVAGHPIRFVELTEAQQLSGETYSSASLYLETRVRAASSIHRPQEYVAHVLELRSGRGGPNPICLVLGGDQAIRQRLESAEYPFDGIDGLARVALESAVTPGSQGCTLVEVVAPLGVALDRMTTTFERGLLRVGLWAASEAAAEHCRIGYIAEHQDRSYSNGTIRVPLLDWIGEGEKSGVAQLQLSRSTTKVSLLVRVGPHIVERHSVADTSRGAENPHLAMHLELDPEFKHLRGAFRISDKVADKRREDAAARFEHAVARLFSIVGLHVDVLGRSLQNSFDVLARTPDGTIALAIECTLGALSSGTGKPGRLIGRVHELRTVPGLSESEVIPVMVTSRSVGAIQKSELQAAARDSIAVLHREDLLEILRLAESGGSASDVTALCRRAVPPLADDEGFVSPFAQRS